MRLALFSLMLLAGCASATAVAAPIEWTVVPTRNEADVQLTIVQRDHDNNSTVSQSLRRTDLDGLDRGNGTSRRFVVRRPAGTLDCSGVFKGRRGTGTCAFSADPAFMRALASRGIAAPNERQAVQLALHRADLQLVDALAHNGYATPTVDQLIAAGIFGVTPAYVQSLADAGFRMGALDKLVTFRIHGIERDWVRALGRASPSLTRVSAEQLVTMKIHGVSVADIEAYGKLGYRDLTPKQLVAMSIQGVSPEFVRRTQERRGDRLDPDRLIAMRVLGGVN